MGVVCLEDDSLQNRKRRLLQIPQGTESIYLEEAFRHRGIVRGLEDLFTSWGYLPAQVPVFDFFDIYRDLLHDEAVDIIYRLIDRDGDLLMLRSDITLFLAKHIGAALRKEDLPLRIWYADTILRHQDREDISRNEFFQVGAELIGKPGIRGDVEVLALLADILAFLDLPETFIHIGSRRVFNTISGLMSGETRSILSKCVAVRDIQGMYRCLAPHYDGKTSESYVHVLTFVGDIKELKKLSAKSDPMAIPKEIRSELRYVSRIADTISQAYPRAKIRIDLSEIGSQPYYTGVVFQVYMRGADRAVASGGRYDQLLGHFGYACPSVGFSLLLRKVEHAIQDTGRFAVSKPVNIDGRNILEALTKAREIRKTGGVATI